jgi:histidyl-tRNA synthetase
MAGGRYDGLVEMMGGPPTPGVGWASGIERVAMMLAEGNEAPHPIAVIPIGEGAANLAARITESLRSEGYAVDLGFSGNLAKRMKRANKLNARAAILLGDDEIAKGVATVRDMTTGAQEQVSLEQLASRLAAFGR